MILVVAFGMISHGDGQQYRDPKLLSKTCGRNLLHTLLELMLPTEDMLMIQVVFSYFKIFVLTRFIHQACTYLST